MEHPDLIVGLNTADDAGVYRISDDTALIQTVDFFTPIVDDARTYGQVAAANALSDVYAMGGRPVTALNICAFPSEKIDAATASEILIGGPEKVREAGAVVVGGHTVEDDEPKYGLAVTGLVHPERVVTNAGARPGDRLILTKRLGTGLMTDAYRDGEIDETALQPAIDSMVALNKPSSEAMVAQRAHACTDVTGFGLLGHARELAAASKVALRFRASELLTFDLAREIARRRQGGGLRRNRLAFEPFVQVADTVQEAMRRLLFDPQTSGGLLIAVAPHRSNPLREALANGGVEAAEVGDLAAGPSGEIEVLS